MVNGEQAQQLREPFRPEQVGKLPRGGVQLDYVGHAAVTDRLLQVDPGWVWEPVAFDVDGAPLVRHVGRTYELWIRLTVCGVTRYGVGTCPDNKADAAKELIGDAIRNAAMRFGVALDLWSKEELLPVDDRPADPSAPPPVRRTRANRPAGPDPIEDTPVAYAVPDLVDAVLSEISVLPDAQQVELRAFMTGKRLPALRRNRDTYPAPLLAVVQAELERLQAKADEAAGVA